MKRVKQAVFLFLFLSIPFFIQGRVTNDSSLNPPKWFIGWLFSPNYAYRSIIAGNSSESYSNTSYKASDQLPKYGWHHGLLVSRKITSWLYCQTGLLIDKKGYQTKTLYDTIIGKGYFVSVNNKKFDFTCLSAEIPFFIEGKINFTQKIYLRITGGIAFGVGWNEYERNDEMRFVKDIDNWTATTFCKVGFSFLLRHNNYFTLMPSYSYMINSFNDYYIPATINLYSLGLEVGIHCRLDRKNK